MNLTKIIVLPETPNIKLNILRENEDITFLEALSGEIIDKYSIKIETERIV